MTAKKQPASRPHDAAVVELLRADPDFANEYLAAALDEADEPGGQAALLAALRHVAEAQGTGRIVFTNSKGLVGVGLPRKGSRTTPRTRITTPDGKVREGNFGWDDLWTYASAEAGDSEETQKRGGTPKVPDGTTITQWLTDDTLPGGPREVQRTYTAPFARASREDDYRVAWAFFEGGAT